MRVASRRTSLSKVDGVFRHVQFGPQRRPCARLRSASAPLIISTSLYFLLVHASPLFCAHALSAAAKFSSIAAAENHICFCADSGVKVRTMSGSNSLAMGYALPGLALSLVFLYFLAVRRLNFVDSDTAEVVRYAPPAGLSPGVAAWLVDRSDLARAMASAIVNMAAKAYLRIEQENDFYSITRLGPDCSLDLAPEEDALARTLFKGYDCFDFDVASPQFDEALEALRCALVDTTYFSKHISRSVPAWIISGAAVFLALRHGNFFARVAEYGKTPLVSAALSLLALACAYLAMNIHSLPNTLEKISSRLPGSTAPKRPWSAYDSTLLIMSVGGIVLLGLLSTFLAALFAACFLALNTFWFHSLQGLSAEGRKILARINEYKRFLASTGADRISRMRPSTAVPAEFTAEHAYAIAFHIDLGWGEQFVGAIAELI
ncbi:MAG TPA: hypothetical protein VKS20_11185 [Candidatus Acidoferrales bacterium]|nr:hypothetical protein [Candidatus Acidoferrales bacterium]